MQVRRRHLRRRPSSRTCSLWRKVSRSPTRAAAPRLARFASERRRETSETKADKHKRLFFQIVSRPFTLRTERNAAVGLSLDFPCLSWSWDACHQLDSPKINSTASNACINASRYFSPPHLLSLLSPTFFTNKVSISKQYMLTFGQN